MENNCIGIFQARKLTVKWHLSESLTFQNLFKNRKLLPAEKFGNVLAFDKESKTKLLSLISADSFIKNNLYNDFRVEISFMAKWKTFWFQKNFIQILWIFSCIKCILVRLWVKVFVSQGWVQAEITIHYKSVLISWTF